MDIFKIKNLTFSYPEETPVLKEIDFSVKEGQMVLLLGASGSGKTTFLKQLKPQLTPHGATTGEIYYEEQLLKEVSYRQTAAEIGYVFQNPKHQIVTDKVWHELAFGLENLHMSQAEMELKIGEVASYFGIQNWFHKNVEDLSGGQQQILNLAAVLVMNPKVILLDEPTSQLDPIAARNFLELVQRVKEELGITIILSEHRTDEIYHMADQIAVMEDGRMAFTGTPQETAIYLSEKKSFLMPVIPKICLDVSAIINKQKQDTSTNQENFLSEQEMDIPLNLLQGRNWLKRELGQQHLRNNGNHSDAIKKSKDKIERKNKPQKAVVVKELYYRYDKQEKDILNHLQFTVQEGENFGIVGGNGVGKTTLLKILAGFLKAYAGKVKVTSKVGYLPQDPQLMFTSDIVCQEISTNAMQWISLFQMEHLLQKHPYDLSGGEQQRLALLKLLDQQPEILLLDEPTKGMDEAAKKVLGEILLTLQKEGKTIIMVTHDITFAARYTNRCGLLFDGRLTGVQKTREFFLGNQYYTTTARRVTNGIIPGIVLEEDLWQ